MSLSEITCKMKTKETQFKFQLVYFDLFLIRDIRTAVAITGTI